MEREEQHLKNLYAPEKLLWEQGIRLVGGIDEAGRGPLAGPVVAAVVVFEDFCFLSGLNDSKKVRPAQRLALAAKIKKSALAWGVAAASAQTIDRINIRKATELAMRRALCKLKLKPDFLLIDGFPLPGVKIPQKALVAGDQRSASIAAASILAKVTRDRIMEKVDFVYPAYGFAHHKGYPTPQHYQALTTYGPCPLHRYSFRLK